MSCMKNILLRVTKIMFDIVEIHWRISGGQTHGNYTHSVSLNIIGPDIKIPKPSYAIAKHMMVRLRTELTSEIFKMSFFIL